MTRFRALRATFPFAFLVGCFVSFSGDGFAQTDRPGLPPDTLPAALNYEHLPAGLSNRPEPPEDNVMTAERIELGRRLFFDGRLSHDGTISCASCHVPSHGFAGTERISPGVGGALGNRNSPSVINRVYGTAFFWDGRAKTLEEQALQPIENPVEMAAKLPQVVERLKQDKRYVDQFRKAYGAEIDAKNLAKALACFQRALLSGSSPVDRFLGGEFSALTTEQRQGMWLFESRGNCWKCHGGPNHSDEGFHNSGVSWGKKPLDLGRFDVTKVEADRGKFHTPSLRNVERTGPYMHDGSMRTLEEVVAFYDKGGGPNPGLDARLQPLHLSEQDRGALVAFLKALTGAEQTSWGGNSVSVAEKPKELP